MRNVKRIKTNSVSEEVIASRVRYCAESGKFYRPDGREIVSQSKEKYLRFNVCGVLYYAHRIAWLCVHGKWPTGHIDHINGNTRDNRIANLRDVDRSVNLQNQRRARVDNLSGLIGAHIHKPSGKYKSKIFVRGYGQKFLGYFNTAEEAHAAYVSAKRQFHEGCTL